MKRSNITPVLGEENF